MAITIDGTNGISSTAISQIAAAGTLKGAVTRSMQSKARDIVSLKDFIPDNFNYATTATAYFVLAANSVTSGANVEVIVPSGNYFLDTSVSGITSTATFIISNDAVFTGSGATTFLNGSVANTRIVKNKLYVVNSAPAAGIAEGIYQFGTTLYVSDGTSVLAAGSNIPAMTDVILAAGTDTVQRTVSAVQLKSAGGVGTYASLANFPANFNGVATTGGKLYIGNGTYNAEIPKKDASGALVLNNAASQDTYTVGTEAMVYTAGNWSDGSGGLSTSTSNYITWIIDGAGYGANFALTYIPAFIANTTYKITLTVYSSDIYGSYIYGSYISVFGIQYTLADLGVAVAVNTTQTVSFFAKTGATPVQYSVMYIVSATSTDTVTFSIKPVVISKYPGLILKDSTGANKISMLIDTNAGSMYIGANSGNNSVDAIYNTTVGIGALQNILSGGYNTAIGYNSNNATYSIINIGNTTIGYNTLTSFSGKYSVAIGNNAMRNAYGYFDIAIGNSALFNNAYNSGGDTSKQGSNIAIGNQAMYGSVTSTLNTQNIAIGAFSLYSCSNGTYSIAIGANALGKATNPSYCIAIGGGAAYYAIPTAPLLAIGYNALNAVTTNSYNVGIGHNALTLVSTGIGTFSIPSGGAGYVDGYYPNVTLTQYAAIITGSISGSVLTVTATTQKILNGQTLFNSSGVSLGTLTFATGTAGSIGTYNLSTSPVGYGTVQTFSLDNNTNYLSGTSNTNPPRVSLVVANGIITNLTIIDCGVGYTTGTFSFFPNNIGNPTTLAIFTATPNTVNTGNTAVGYYSGGLLKFGSNNVIYGTNAAYATSVMSNSVAIGNQAIYGGGQSSTSTTYNFGVTDSTAVGNIALKSSLRASYNTAFGSNALTDLQYGINNIAIGYKSGSNLTTGNNNIIIGTSTSTTSNSTSNSVYIGNIITYYSISPITGSRLGTTNTNGNIIISDGLGNIALHADSYQNITTAANLKANGNISGGYIKQSDALAYQININNVTNKYGDTTVVPSVMVPQIAWTCNSTTTANVPTATTLTNANGAIYYLKGSDFSTLVDGGYNIYRATIIGTSDGVASATSYLEFHEPLLLSGGTAANVSINPATMMVPAKTAAAATDAYTISKLTLGNASPTINAFYGTQLCTYGTSGANTYDIAVGTPTGCTLAAYTPTVGAAAWTMPAPTAFSADVATVVLTITVRNAAGTAQTPITRTLTWNINRPYAAYLYLPSFSVAQYGTNSRMYKSTNYISASNSTFTSIVLDTANHNVFGITPINTATYTFTSAPAGTKITMIVTTSGTTSYTMTFGTNFVSTGPLTTSVTTGTRYVLEFVSDGTSLYEVSRTTGM